jgi:tetratricopeptide (TPR) repeat protein
MEPLLYRAAWLADGAGDDKTRAIAWLRLYGHLGINVGETEKPDLAIVRQQAMAAYERCHAYPAPGGSRAEDELEIEHLSALTDAALGRGHYEEARTHTTAMVSLVEKTYGEGHWRYATALDSLAKMNLLLGDYDAALTLLDRARGMLGRAGATSTPLFAHVESIGGKNLLYLLRLPEAEERFRRSIDIEEQTGGKTENQRLVVPLYNLGMTLAEEGRHDEAAAAYERSIALLAQNLPPTDSRFWEMNLSLADTELAQGKARAAFARVEPLLRNKEARDTFPLIEFVSAKALAALHREPKRARALAVSALDRFAKEEPRKSPRGERRLAEMRAWLDQRPGP